MGPALAFVPVSGVRVQAPVLVSFVSISAAAMLPPFYVRASVPSVRE
jgi:hypothetical protein